MVRERPRGLGAAPGASAVGRAEQRLDHPVKRREPGWPLDAGVRLGQEPRVLRIGGDQGQGQLRDLGVGLQCVADDLSTGAAGGGLG